MIIMMLMMISRRNDDDRALVVCSIIDSLFTACHIDQDLLSLILFACFLPISEKDEDLAAIAAQQYYVEYKSDMSYERLLKLIPSYIPDNAMTGAKTAERWAGMISRQHTSVSHL